MEHKSKDEFRIHPMKVFVCESLPIKPGTKARAKLPRGLEEPFAWARWLAIGGIVLALGVGVFIGRYLLP